MVELDDLRLVHELREQGVGWESVKDTIAGFTDNDRKLYYGYKKGLESKEDSDLVKHAKTLQKIRLSRKRLGVERSINNEQIRDITLHKTFTDQVIEEIKNYAIEFNYVRESNITHYDKNDERHIFVLSDLHYDGNDYILDTLNLAYNAIMDVVEEYDLKHIVLVELGDTVEGASLRTSQLMAVKSGMVQQVIKVAKAYVELIQKLLDNGIDVEMYSVDSSNHTQLRQLGTKQNQLVEEDLMLVFNGFIELALPHLNFIHSEELLIDMLGFNFHLSHGHLIKGKPSNYYDDLQSDRGYLIDFAFYGHRHHKIDMDWHSKGGYDSMIFQVPALAPHTTSYEKDKNLSSCSGVGYYRFNKSGFAESRKLRL